MGSFFNMDGKFFTFMSRVADLMILNILWIICCIPIVTAGAATTALYYVTLKMVRNEESYIFKSFFKSFKENFKQSTILWLIMLVIGIIFAVDLKVVRYMDLGSLNFIKYLIMALFLVYIITMLYLFPIQSKFYNTIKNTLKNSILMAIRHLPRTGAIIVFTFAPFILMAFIPQVMAYGILVFILIGFSLIAFLNSYMFVKIFDVYIQPESDASNDGGDDAQDDSSASEVFSNLTFQSNGDSEEEEQTDNSKDDSES